MKRINYTLVLVGLALTTLLFSCSMKKIKDIKDKFDESEQVKNGVIGGDSLAHVSDTEETRPAVKSTTKTGKITAESSASKKEFTGKVYEIVEQMPEYPGGLTALMNYLRVNIRYPAAAQKAGIEGRVIVSFIVEPNGSVSNLEIVRSVDTDLDQEALRVVRQMPKWKPGKQDGSTVRVKFHLPIKFMLV